MQIFLLRHGEAEGQALSDAQRRLTSRGHSDNRNTAKQWLELSPHIERTLVSPLLRAQQTFADFQAVMPGLSLETSDRLLPESSVQGLLEYLAAQTEDSNLLLIGHNPLLSRLSALLCEGSSYTDRYLDTSQLVCIETEVVATGFGVLKYSLRY